MHRGDTVVGYSEAHSVIAAWFCVAGGATVEGVVKFVVAVGVIEGELRGGCKM